MRYRKFEMNFISNNTIIPDNNKISIPNTQRWIERIGNSYLRCGATSVQGYRPHNEDMHDIRLSLHATKFTPPISYAAIFDGHCGSAASEFMHKELPVRLGQLKDPMNHQKLYECIMSCDDDFLHPDNPKRNQGTTCCFILLQPIVSSDLNTSNSSSSSYCSSSSSNSFNFSFPSHLSCSSFRLTIANIGDSRVLLLDPKGKLVFQTLDHKPDILVERQRIENAGGTVISRRVDHKLSLSRAIGDANFKNQFQLKPDEQKVCAVPDLIELPVWNGYIILLFCDGLVERLTNEEVSRFVQQHLQSLNSNKEIDPGFICSQLVDAALTFGSKDNISIIMICICEGSNYNERNEYIKEMKPICEFRNQKKHVKFDNNTDINSTNTSNLTSSTFLKPILKKSLSKIINKK